jgi:hypothetical protein
VKIAHALVSGHSGKLEQEQELEPVTTPVEHNDTDHSHG